jgi:small subunit ribosomal protein S4
MARYRGPQSKIARRFNEPIFGPDKALERKNYGPGQHGNNRRSKKSEYAGQLAEKQKAKYTYGILEKQLTYLKRLLEEKVLQVKSYCNYVKQD